MRALREFCTHHIHLFWILGLAFVLRLWWIHEFDVVPASDFKAYYDNAMRFAEGKSFVVNNIEPKSAFWPIGWPFFLSIFFRLFGPSVLLAKLIGVACYLTAMTICYWMVLRATDSRLAASFSAFMLAIYPNHIALATILYSEYLYMALLLGGIWLYLARTGETEPRRCVHLGLAGVILGASTLVRTHSLYVPVLLMILAPGLWFSARGHAGWAQWARANGFIAARRLVLMYAGLFAVISPWLVRNYCAFGKPVMVTSVGFNLLVATDTVKPIRPRKNPRYDYMYDYTRNEAERDAWAKKQAIAIIMQNPMRYLESAPSKLAEAYRIDHDGFSQSEKSLQAIPAVVAEPKRAFLDRMIDLNFRYYVWLSVLGILGAAQGVGSNRTEVRRLSTVAIGLSLYFTLFIVVFYGQIRYRYPVSIFSAAMAGVFAGKMKGFFDARFGNGSARIKP